MYNSVGKICRNFIFGLLLACAASFSLGSNIPMYSAEQIAKFSFPLRISIPEIVDLLRIDLGIRVHFESEKLNFERDGFSANRIAELYSSRSGETLSDGERRIFEYAKKCIESGDGDLIIDYRKPFILLTPDDLTDIAKLSKKIEATNVYSVQSSKDAIIIYPVNSSYENVENFIGNFNSASDAYEAIEPLLAERNLCNVLIFQGLVRLPQGDLRTQSSIGKVKLNIANEDFRSFLTIFAETLGPHVVWNISGYDTGRHVSFNRISLRINNFKVEDADMGKVIETLRAVYPLGICCEMEALDPQKYAITAQKCYEELSGREMLNDRERIMLETADSLRVDSPDVIIGWNTPRHSLAFNSLMIDELLDEIIKFYPQYGYTIDNRGYVTIYPQKNSALQFELPKSNIENLTLSQVLSLYQKQLFAAQNITVGGYLYTGPVPRDSAINIDPYSVRVLIPEIPKMRCIDFLTVLAEEAETKLEWTLGGMAGARLLFFNKVN